MGCLDIHYTAGRAAGQSSRRFFCVTSCQTRKGITEQESLPLGSEYYFVKRNRKENNWKEQPKLNRQESKTEMINEGGPTPKYFK